MALRGCIAKGEKYANEKVDSRYCGGWSGGGLGLGADALIGDQMQAQENRNYQQDQEIRRQQYEIDRLRRERSEY